MEYNVIKGYFHLGLFSKSDLELFVQCGWITEEEKTEILEGENNEDKTL